GELGEKVLPILVDSSKPIAPGHLGDSGHMRDARCIADRQGVDERNGVSGDHAVGAGSIGARVPGGGDRAQEEEADSRDYNPAGGEPRSGIVAQESLPQRQAGQRHVSSPLSSRRRTLAASAACGSCVTISTVLPRVWLSVRRSESTSSALLRSRSPVG